ncbi:MAG: hypothetical protein OER95_06215, partial [Acidimicrobiia bacterium]|nr:hypothetical protein [Acidimicrobiia bacterium]
MALSVSLSYLGYEASRERPNIVVDGSPNEGTVLTLTHWPGYPVAPELQADLSAGIAFKYLNQVISGAAVEPAEFVTNNHFDQDGLVAAHALVNPEESLPHRDLLCDLAAAGDFAVYRDRRAARASMVFSRLAEREMTGDYGSFIDELYREALPMVLPVLLDPDRYRDYWAEEDEELTRAEEAVARRRITFEHHQDVDLAVVHVPEDFASPGGHRFGGDRFRDVHPMAIHNVVDEFRLLLVSGRRYRFVDRYESWVQYRNRRVLPRVDLRPGRVAVVDGAPSGHLDGQRARFVDPRTQSSGRIDAGRRRGGQPDHQPPALPTPRLGSLRRRVGERRSRRGLLSVGRIRLDRWIATTEPWTGSARPPPNGS